MSPMTIAICGHGHPIQVVAFSPDGTSLATATKSLDNTVKLWDVASG